MSKFLDTQSISSELMVLIKNAKDKIVLVSPYLKVNSQIQERLKTKSKIGTLSEISIIYGKSELKQTELDWMKDVDDIRIFEKNNLHAKCYLNEERAIICSMNLYDYSQQNNIEMGILITKEEDPATYTDIIEEIANLKINGRRINLELDQFSIKKENPSLLNSEEPSLSPIQLLRKNLFESYRTRISKSEYTKPDSILSDVSITYLITKDVIYWEDVKETLSSKQLNRYGRAIMDVFYSTRDYEIGRIVDVHYQSNDQYYDRIKFQNFETNYTNWFDTTQELPNKNSIVAVSLNGNWFNQYIYIEK